MKILGKNQLGLLFLLGVTLTLTGCVDFDGKLNERREDLKSQSKDLKNKIRKVASLLDERDQLDQQKRYLEVQIELMQQRLKGPPKK